MNLKPKSKKRTPKRLEFVSPYSIQDCVTILNDLPGEQTMEKLRGEVSTLASGTCSFTFSLQILSGRPEIWVEVRGHLKSRDDGMTEVVIEAENSSAANYLGCLVAAIPLVGLFLIMNWDANGPVTSILILIGALLFFVLLSQQGSRDTRRLMLLIEVVLDPD